MTAVIKIDWEGGFVRVADKLLTTDGAGTLSPDILRMCAHGELTRDGVTRYCLSNAVSVHGFAAECVLDVSHGRLRSMGLLFQHMEFFDRSILESKIIKAMEKNCGLSFLSRHPAAAVLPARPWGKAEFAYDPKQGDLALILVFNGLPGPT